MADRYAEDLNLALSSGNADAIRIASNAIPGNQGPQAPAATTPASDPRISQLQAQMADLQAQNAAQLQRQRTSAFDTMAATLKQYGIDADGTGLAATIKGWAQEDKSASWMQLELRNTDAYKKRFTGMQALISKGQAISEAEYISQERSYANTMRQYGIPTEFFDGPDDFGKLISNGVSVKELDDRVKGATTFLNSRQEYKDQLIAMGVSEGALLAHVLDADRAQTVIQNELKQATLGGAARTQGFDLTNDQVDRYAQATMGDQYNVIGRDQIAMQEQTFGKLGLQANEQSRLASIDQSAFNRNDILDAELLNNNDKKLASQQRREREASRFSGSSAIGQGTLSRKRAF